MTQGQLKAFSVSLLLSLSLPLKASIKIVGGEPVKDRAEASYVVRAGTCGSSIIAAKWLLSAAHCGLRMSTVKAGALNLKEEGHNLKVKRVIRHPRYRSVTEGFDYALIELEEPIDFEATGLRPVKLADPAFAELGGQDPGLDSTVYGWGNLREGTPNREEQLMKVIVPLVSDEEANAPAAYNGRISATMIAAGLKEGGKDSCQGDSGGPLVVLDHRNEPVQVGVVSWGTGCARALKYGVYAKVSAGYAWIQETMASAE
jgi:trypsin